MNTTEESRGLVTCVKVTKQTRDLLADVGKKNQTFDDIIKELILARNSKFSQYEEEIAS